MVVVVGLMVLVMVMVGRHFDNRGGCGSVRLWKGNTEEDEELIMCVDGGVFACLFVYVCMCTCVYVRDLSCLYVRFRVFLNLPKPRPVLRITTAITTHSLRRQNLHCLPPPPLPSNVFCAAIHLPISGFLDEAFASPNNIP